MSTFRSSRFDPALIFSQIITLQCSFYFLLCLFLIIFYALVGYVPQPSPGPVVTSGASEGSLYVPVNNPNKKENLKESDNLHQKWNVSLLHYNISSEEASSIASPLLVPSSPLPISALSNHSSDNEVTAFSFGMLFDPSILDITSLNGILFILILLATVYPMAVWMSLVVGRARQSFDFSFTLVFIHFLLTWWHSGIPMLYSWWFIYLSYLTLLSLTAERCAMKRELEPIMLSVASGLGSASTSTKQAPPLTLSRFLGDIVDGVAERVSDRWTASLGALGSSSLVIYVSKAAAKCRSGFLALFFVFRRWRGDPTTLNTPSRTSLYSPLNQTIYMKSPMSTSRSSLALSTFRSKTDDPEIVMDV